MQRDDFITLNGGTIVAGSRFEIIDEGFISISGGTIIEMGVGRPTESGKIHYDARNMILVPGFINAHTHIGDGLAKEVALGLSLEEAVLPPYGLKHRILSSAEKGEFCLSLRNGVQELVHCGCTGFADFREGGLEGVQMVKTELGPKAPDGVILGRFNSPSPFSESELMENKKPLSSLLREELRQLMSEADGLGISGANDFTDPALSEIGSSLRKLGKMIGIHVSESESYGALSKRRTGVGDLERVIHHLQPDFLVHMTQATQREAEMTAEAHLPVVLCPRSNCLFGLGVPPVRMLLEKGILVALGTDNFMANSPDLFREMEFTSKLIRGVEHNPSYPSAVEVLKMVTLNPAMILRKEKKVGSLERGKRADILFIDKTSPALHPLRSVVASIIHRAGPADLKAVMISGAWVKGNLPTGA